MNTRKINEFLTDKNSSVDLYDTEYHGFTFGRGYRPKTSNSIKATNVEPDEAKTWQSLILLRQRQRELGLLDSSGNLYDPTTKKWVSASFMPVDEQKHIEDLYADLLYFEHYPEIKNGLPPDIIKLRNESCESSFLGIKM